MQTPSREMTWLMRSRKQQRPDLRISQYVGVCHDDIILAEPEHPGQPGCLASNHASQARTPKGPKIIPFCHHAEVTRGVPPLQSQTPKMPTSLCCQRFGKKLPLPRITHATAHARHGPHGARSSPMGPPWGPLGTHWAKGAHGPRPSGANILACQGV